MLTKLIFKSFNLIHKNLEQTRFQPYGLLIWCYGDRPYSNYKHYHYMEKKYVSPYTFHRWKNIILFLEWHEGEKMMTVFSFLNELSH